MNSLAAAPLAGNNTVIFRAGADLGEGCRGCAPPPPEMTCGFLIQLVFKKTMWSIGVEVEKETSAPPPKKNPGSAPAPELPLWNGYYLLAQ